MKSGSAHCDPELADEVRQCPLRSGAGEEAAEEKKEEEAAGSSDKIYQPSPGRWGNMKNTYIIYHKTIQLDKIKLVPENRGDHFPD